MQRKAGALGVPSESEGPGFETSHGSFAPINNKKFNFNLAVCEFCFERDFNLYEMNVTMSRYFQGAQVPKSNRLIF